MTQSSRNLEASQQDATRKNATTHSRRKFIKTSSGLIAGTTLAASQTFSYGIQPAETETIRVGLIGCGGRGTDAAMNAMSVEDENVKILAMADAFRGQLDRSYKKMARRFENKLDVPEDRKFSGLDAYQKVLQTDCDLVILATPPGFRPPHFAAAVEAGKHVFAEKPLAVDGQGVRSVLEAGKLASKKGLGVGIGLQRRHDPKYKEAIARIHGGQIGQVLLSRVYWNGGDLWIRSRSDFARTFGHDPSELEYQVFNWYYFNWLCGDHIVEQHIHNLDVSNWVRQMVPTSAQGMGGRQVRNGPDHGQIFDHHAVEFTYPDGTTMLSQCRQLSGCATAVEENFSGCLGTARLHARGPNLIKSGEEELSYPSVKISPYVQEHVDLLASIRSGSPYNEAEYGATSTMTAIMGRLATYSGNIITWDEALNSQLSLAPESPLSWDATPPVRPDSNGRYPVPVPGKTKVV